MTKTANRPKTEQGVKTGRRVNPDIEPRDRTVCFMLGEGEKAAVDRLAFCINLTRSGLLAKIVTQFIEAAEGSKVGAEAEKALIEYLEECRGAVQKRGASAKEWISSGGKQ